MLPSAFCKSLCMELALPANMKFAENNSACVMAMTCRVDTQLREESVCAMQVRLTFL